MFLGDYVDRTPYGFEVMLLLYSLKIKWPDRIFLLRGNHELESINTAYGFKVRTGLVCTLAYCKGGSRLGELQRI